jgi:hypothetical protein
VELSEVEKSGRKSTVSRVSQSGESESQRSWDKEVLEARDLAKFVNRYTDSEASRRLKIVFGSLETSSDRANFAAELLENYTGKYPARGAGVLSMAMREWPKDFTDAVVSGLQSDPSLLETIISTHASGQQIRGNEDGLRAMYLTLEPGRTRREIAQKMTALSFETGGVTSALDTISHLHFLPEKTQAINEILSKITIEILSGSASKKASSGEIFSIEDYQRVIEDHTRGWENSHEIQKSVEEVKARLQIFEGGK